MFIKTITTSLITLILAGCSVEESIEMPEQIVEIYSLPTEVNSVQRDFNGIARAHDLVDLAFRVDGEIKSININKGQKVNKGDVLAVLDKRDYQIVVDDRKARLVLTEQQFERAKALLDKKLLSQSEYDKMRAEYLVALADYKKATLMFEYTELKAPFDGIIGDVFSDPFVNVQPGSAVLSLHKVDFVEVDVQLPDMILAVAKLGENRIKNLDVKVTYEAFPDKTFTATPYELNLEKDTSTRSYIATFLVPFDNQFGVLEGMPAKVSIDLSDLTYTYSRDFLVPVAAVVMPDGSRIGQQRPVVWRYKDDQTVESQEVELGTLSGDMIEINQGLNDGDVIVSVGANKLVDGQKVVLKKGKR
ncbi:MULTISPECIES: efflux RND transporter periplasmic adaptor subunit [unclassified Agarivorans]|uniref:efflux RND transporter periplasmic adaptor subunit n=1 Tax=unclassified Agarivorans TaxID=2636026 RepID=UPI0026E249E0|nr:MULTISPECIES: efflux RND transporter periplasmic adaptor subunit [unclassified Agarivorans]MDO6687819.1 efflux RND transporter periplasmic adaptor subunit [Agarivorans sp. 3_MG-2023]MDO6717317.1 efflux RND transporter periplasmic adaptor subunit [Agarivorans sp. 2_MG-2023]